MGCESQSQREFYMRRWNSGLATALESERDTNSHLPVSGPEDLWEGAFSLEKDTREAGTSGETKVLVDGEDRENI